MKTKTNRNLSLSKWVGVALIAAGGLSACTDGYDLAEKDPSWLGSSIYDYLKSNGNYTNLVHLIDDLGYTEVLAKTGSKTLFVADDAAYNRFFQKNDWGVHSYRDLSLAQKKLLLNGSMINNACQVAYLSSSEGPTEGDCMRRLTSTSAYDSVPVLMPSQMPDNPYWKRYRKEEEPMVCFSDKTVSPMIHFIEMFLKRKLITNDDCDFLFNYEKKRQPGDANVNGIMMTQQNIKCSNGFVHKMADVLTPLPSMADFISQHSTTQGYAKLLNRFCAPYGYGGDDELRVEYNRLYNTNVDSVFEKRYFSKRSQGGLPLELTPDEGPVPGQLKFDPGWNQFYSQTVSSTSEGVALQENMGVMLVPTDVALDRYFNEGAGKVLKDYYGSWENVPDEVVAEMLNVNMLNSFVNSVPSKFHTVLNDANDELGLKEAFVDSVYMACNGAVYLTNKVFNPVSYVSVTFPALVNETMNILWWATDPDICDFRIYLNSQNSYFSLFIPNNKSLLEYIDPCSFGEAETRLFRFHWHPTGQTKRDKVKAGIWRYNVETGEVGDSIGEATFDQIRNRLIDILDTHVVLGDVEDGSEFYRTKGGSIVKVTNPSAGENGMTVQGGWQLEKGYGVPVVQVYDESYEGNGKTYILADEPIMTARNSVYDILSAHPEFSEFRKLLESSSYLTEKHTLGSLTYDAPSKNISLFNTYRYTVYVPTNKAITDLQDAGTLPTWDDVENLRIEGEDEEADRLTALIENFIKYHIQDESFYVGMDLGPTKKEEGDYETSAYKVIDGNLSYYKLHVNAEQDGITLRDGKGDVHKVVTTGDLYNLMGREYQYGDPDPKNHFRNLYTSSFAVVHQIDGALQYE